MLSTVNGSNASCTYRHSDKTFIRVNPILIEYLTELGFALENNDYEFSPGLVNELKLLIISINEEYNLIKDNSLNEDFTELSLCEPWLFNFLKSAVEQKKAFLTRGKSDRENI